MRVRQTGGRVLLAVLACGSGIALVVTLVSGLPLLLGLALLGTAAVCLVGLRCAQSTDTERVRLRRQLLTGVVAGIGATAAYDVARWLLVAVGQLTLRPFDTFRLFGELLTGVPAVGMALVAGTVYHVMNGVCFATAYCLLIGGRDWRLAIVWALVLEAAMLSVYPRWLDLEGGSTSSWRSAWWRT